MLWAMKAKLLGLGGLQVGLTTAVVTGAAMALGQPWTIALAIGLIMSLSSTAIVLQTLGEKGLLKSDGGQSGFQVLLFQDIAVIPMLALIPLLAMPDLIEAASHGVDVAHGTASHAAEAGDHSAGPGLHRNASRLAARPCHHRRDRRRGSGRQRSDPTDLPLHRHGETARAVHRHRADDGHRHRPADDAGRPVAGAGHLSGGRRAGQQRIPARAGIRHRPVQGPAAGPVLHDGRRGHRFRPAVRPDRHHPGADAGPDRRSRLA